MPKVGWGYGKRTFIGMVLDDAFAPSAVLSGGNMVECHDWSRSPCFCEDKIAVASAKAHRSHSGGSDVGNH